MDNLPSATKYVDETNPAKPLTIYDLGFPLGVRSHPAAAPRGNGAVVRPHTRTGPLHFECRAGSCLLDVDS